VIFRPQVSFPPPAPAVFRDIRRPDARIHIVAISPGDFMKAR
jgi:hypothetical protein